MLPTDADDDEWLKALKAGDHSKHRDAAILKRALEMRARHLSAQVPVADDQLYSQLRFRLRREKLLTEGFGAHRLVAVAASVVGVALITFALLPDRGWDDYSSIRSAGDAQVVFVPDPETEAQGLVARLKAAGVTARLEHAHDKVIVVVPASLDAIESLEQMKVRSSKAGDHLEVTYQKRP